MEQQELQNADGKKITKKALLEYAKSFKEQKWGQEELAAYLKEAGYRPPGKFTVWSQPAVSRMLIQAGYSWRKGKQVSHTVRRKRRTKKEVAEAATPRRKQQWEEKVNSADIDSITEVLSLITTIKESSALEQETKDFIARVLIDTLTQGKGELR